MLGSFVREPQASSSKVALSGHASVHELLQRSEANSAQISSQITVQQLGKPAQTVSQQIGSEQLELPWGIKQSPANGSPHVKGAGKVQLSCAVRAHVKSHASSQQKASNEYTNAQHTASEHEALSREMKHEPKPGIPQTSQISFAQSKQS